MARSVDQALLRGPSNGIRGNGQKLKEVPPKHEEELRFASDHSLEQIAQRGYGVSFTGDIPDPCCGMTLFDSGSIAVSPELILLSGSQHQFQQDVHSCPSEGTVPFQGQGTPRLHGRAGALWGLVWDRDRTVRLCCLIQAARDTEEEMEVDMDREESMEVDVKETVEEMEVSEVEELEEMMKVDMKEEMEDMEMNEEDEEEPMIVG
ncbi:hypothetical protein HGM15179_007513 [Zosterops borbonicus]|uniref:Uncharacterized protein n=1 Tax=Zosterops borbonicus TaxID=364589 RepID=A0A8K1GLF1_9PASS|nr:hypothetical protein HGM15179_007513 [Zosterops borbonicus]